MTDKHDQAPNAARRAFLRNSTAVGAAIGTVGGLAACGSGSPDVATGRTVVDDPTGETLPNPFKHGIATGDPTSQKIVFWTRLSQNVTATPSATLKIYSDKDAAQLISTGSTIIQATDASRDFTIKIDAPLPKAYTSYYYQFECTLDDQTFKSQIGRTKTLPGTGNDGATVEAPAEKMPGSDDQEQHMRIGIASCSSYAHGFFNAYARMAERNDLDVVLHLGDYIYDYADIEGREPPARPEPGVAHAYGDIRRYQPNHEIVTLEDYRNRHAHYKQDFDLQELHRQNAMINIWDDHELVDNAYRCLGKNHNQTNQHKFKDDGTTPDTEGEAAGNSGSTLKSWAERSVNAIQAYREWLPIRDELPKEYDTADLTQAPVSISLQPYIDQLAPDDASGLFTALNPIIYRSFQMGKFAKLTMLDTRFVGRDIEPEPDVVIPGFPLPLTSNNHPIHAEAIKDSEMDCSVDARYSDQADIDYEDARTEDEYLRRADGANNHNVLGPTQKNWLESQFKHSTHENIRWNILGQQIMVGHLMLFNTPAVKDPVLGTELAPSQRYFINPDQWDGYKTAREELHRLLKDECKFNDGSVDRNNCVILTGDIHTSWAFDITEDPGPGDPSQVAAATPSELTPPAGVTGALGAISGGAIAAASGGDYNSGTGDGSFAAEFVCPSVTSPGLGDFSQVQDLLKSQNPHMKHVDLGKHGYVVLDLRENYVQSQWWTVGEQADIQGITFTQTLDRVHNASYNSNNALHVQAAIDPADAAVEPSRDGMADLAPFTDQTA